VEGAVCRALEDDFNMNVQKKYECICHYYCVMAIWASLVRSCKHMRNSCDKKCDFQINLGAYRCMPNIALLNFASKELLTPFVSMATLTLVTHTTYDRVMN
jgi:hypothetical protein